MDTTALLRIAFFVFTTVAVVFFIELVYLAIAGPIQRKRSINRRLGALDKGAAGEQVLNRLRAERGITGDNLQALGWLRKLLIHSGLRITAAKFAFLLIVLLVGLLTILKLLLGLSTVVSIPIAAFFGIVVPLQIVRIIRSKRQKKFAEQLPDNLLVMAASLRAGHSFVGALNAVVEEADEPARSELRRAVADEQLGVPMENALIRVAERMKNGDLEQVALVASLQRETGGNTAAVLDTVVDTVRERFELRCMVMTLTAQGRLTRWILIGLPIAVGVLASLLNPYYMRPLFTTAAGQVMLAVVIAMMIVGSFMIKKILEIEL